VALLLRRRGVSRIRPLAGGFQAWLGGGFPVVPVTNQAAPAPALDERPAPLA